ncbi:orotate phosphoribosyltransferase [Ferruginibacter yonginensis]|uniref:Orotate phosphoribosyltransferase n=1 Tax=Ferruginibacter yonginensis TaxID=1310416 RepID=A0ABV8QPJ1_9BACT
MTSAAEAIAEKLLQINAVKLNIEYPYTWASGWKSPIYCDNRRALGYPYVRDFIKSELCAVIFEQFAGAEAIAGVATAGISWGAMAADQLKLPFMYVRPKPKEHGMGNQIEGMYEKGQTVVVVEDLISTGKSSLEVCKVLQKEGLIIEGMVSIFNYGFPQASEAFAEAGIKLYSLSNYESLIAHAQAKGTLTDEQLKSLLNWREQPATWGK